MERGWIDCRALGRDIRVARRLSDPSVAYALAYRGELDRAFEVLEQADSRDVGVGVMASHSMLQALHSDPRWLPFLERVGLSPEQLAAITFDVKVPNQSE